MKNTLTDLNNALFAELENLQDESMDPERATAALRRSQAVSQIAEVIIRNGELALKTMQHLNEMGYTANTIDSRDLAPVPVMLEAK